MLKPSYDKTMAVGNILTNPFEKHNFKSLVHHSLGYGVILITIAITSGGLGQDLASLPPNCARRNFPVLQ